MRIRALQLCGTGILATLLTVTGCHRADPNAPEAGDPAAANLATVSGPVNDSVAGAPQYSAGPQQPGPNGGLEAASAGSRRGPAGSPNYQGSENSQNSMPPPPPEETPQDNSQAANQAPAPSGSYDNAGYADEYAGTPGDTYDAGANYDQTTSADQPPPELPQYQQPPCPGDNYLWTPGYWNYAQNNTQPGYFWVPGVWVVAPFIGALWTPGYWGAEGLGYGFHHGYWGPHIGFYGGISYGYGYFGRGYEGGYWNRDRFFYNRSVTRINTTVVRNTYVHNVTINNYNRVAYNGGRGGVAVHPVPYERAAAREQHFGALPVQRQHIAQAMANHAQFARNNGGRPQVLAAAHPLAGRTVATARAANLRPVLNRGGFERPGRVIHNNVANSNIAAQRDQQQRMQGNAPRAAQDQQRVQLNQQKAQQNRQRAQGNVQHAAQDQQRAQLNQQRAQQNAQKVQADRQRVQINEQRVQQAQQRAQPNQQRIQQDQQRIQQNQQRAQQNQARQQQDQLRQQQNQQRQQQAQQRAQQQQQRTQQQQQRLQNDQQRNQQRAAQQQRAQPRTEPRPAPQAAPHAEAPHAAAGGDRGHR